MILCWLLGHKYIEVVRSNGVRTRECCRCGVESFRYDPNGARKR